MSIRGKRSLCNKNVSDRSESVENSSIANLSLKLCITFKKKTAETSHVWEHYGILLAKNVESLDDEHFYCFPCLQQEKKKLELQKGCTLIKNSQSQINYLKWQFKKSVVYCA